MTVPPRGIKPYHTQWAAQHYTAAELSRRGYIVTLTLGHAPAMDLLVVSPGDRTVPIEVKGQQGQSDWFIRRPRRMNTLYILVAVPTGDHQHAGAPRFFVMTATEVCDAMDQYLRDRRVRGTSDAKWVDGIRWKDAKPHLDRWEKLPE